MKKRHTSKSQVKITKKAVLITGASSGIGEASAYALATQGFDLVLGARRLGRLKHIQKEIKKTHPDCKVWVSALDVTQQKSVERFVKNAVQEFGQIDALINNAGLAIGRDPLVAGKEKDWNAMIQTNLAGLLFVTQTVLKQMLTQKTGGDILNLSSIAAHLSYAGGAVYCATKAGVRAITESLRQEVLGKPIRIGSIDPGMVETEFSLIRYQGDKEQAQNTYKGMTPLKAHDVAECIAFMLTRPKHVCIDRILINPTDQAGLNVARS